MTLTLDDVNRRVKRRSLAREIWSWVWELGLAVIVALLVRIFLIDFVGVSGPSMIPTLLDHQHMMVNKIVYHVQAPKRGQIVVCKYPNRRENIVKRIVGLPGDTLSISNGTLYINDQPIPEQYTNNAMSGYDFDEVVIPEGHYFMMGDNRYDSHDCRSADVGPLPRANIVGRVEAIVWPFNYFHWIKNPYDTLPVQEAADLVPQPQ